MAKVHKAAGNTLLIAADRFEEAGETCVTDPSKASLDAAQDYTISIRLWCRTLQREYNVDSCGLR
jgi:hypothetical protein